VPGARQPECGGQFRDHKGLTSEDGTTTAQYINHRPGALCRSIGDAARMVDAMKGPDNGFDTRDTFTVSPKALASTKPYAAFAAAQPREPTDKP